MNEYTMGTKCVQAGYTPGNGEPRQIPIVQSTTFKYDTSEDMGKLFDLEASGYFYTLLPVRPPIFLLCLIFVSAAVILWHLHQSMVVHLI